MRLYFKTMTAKTITLEDVEGSDTILQLKQRFKEKEGVPLEHQLYAFAGKRLENDRTIAEYNIQHESTIQFIYYDTTTQTTQ